MNTTPQPDFHPDAESLNAFMEQLLAEPERERILGHIASCNRCRQVVYLAQAAASGEETPAPPATPAFHSARHWTNWRFAWVLAIAMAAIVTLAIFLHRPHSAPGSEYARVAPRAEEAVPMPSSQKPADAGTAQAPVAANLTARTTTSTPGRSDSQALSPAAASSMALPAEAGAIEPPAADSQAAAMSAGGSEERLSAPKAAAQLKRETIEAASQSQFANGVPTSNTTTAKISPVRMKSMAGPVPASRNLTVAAAAPRLEMKAVSSGSFDRTVQPSIVGAHAPGAPHLPSGLAAVSTATAQHCTLAIDQAGALFLSDNAGQHWESVVRQWDGRAVEVRIKPALSSPPTEVFEIVNDRGLIWASMDGKTWKAN